MPQPTLKSISVLLLEILHRTMRVRTVRRLKGVKKIISIWDTVIARGILKSKADWLKFLTIAETKKLVSLVHLFIILWPIKSKQWFIKSKQWLIKSKQWDSYWIQRSQKIVKKINFSAYWEKVGRLCHFWPMKCKKIGSFFQKNGQEKG